MRHVTVLAVVFLLFTVDAGSASDPALDLGEQLFALGNYDAAITEYKRFLFFHPRPSTSGRGAVQNWIGISRPRMVDGSG